MSLAALDRAFIAPIYSQADVARIIAAPRSTVQNWATGYDTSSGTHQAPVLTGVPRGRGDTVSFMALAEAFVVNAFRKAGLPMQRIRPAVDRLKESIGLEYALANERLAHDGGEIMLKSDDSDDRRLVVVRNGNAVFNEVVEDHLRYIDFSRLGYASSIRLPQFTDAEVVITPVVNGGRPTIRSRGIAIDDVLGRVRAGESPRIVAEDYGISLGELLYLNHAAA